MFAQPLHTTASGPSPWFAQLQAPSAPLEPLAAPIDINLNLVLPVHEHLVQSHALSQSQSQSQPAPGSIPTYPASASQSVSPALSRGVASVSTSSDAQQSKQQQQPVQISGGMLTVSPPAQASGSSSRSSPIAVESMLPSAATTSSMQMQGQAQAPAQTPVQMDVKVETPWEMFPVKGSFGEAFHDYLKPTTALVTGDRYSQLLEAKLGAAQPPAPMSTPMSAPFTPSMLPINTSMSVPPSSPWQQYPTTSTSAPSPLVPAGMSMPNAWATPAPPAWSQMLPAAAPFAHTTPAPALTSAPASTPAPGASTAWSHVRQDSSPMMPSAHSRTSSGSLSTAMPNSSPYNSLLSGPASLPTSVTPAMALSMPPPQGVLPDAQSHLSSNNWATPSWLGAPAEQAPTLLRFRTNPVGPLSPSRAPGAISPEAARIMQAWTTGQMQWDGPLSQTLPGAAVPAQGATRESMPEAYYAPQSWPTAPFQLPTLLPPPPPRHSPGLAERLDPAAATAQGAMPDALAPAGVKQRAGSKMSLSLALPSAPVRTVGASSGRAGASAGSNANGGSERGGRARGSGANGQGSGSHDGRGGDGSQDGQRDDERAGSGGSGGGAGGSGGGGGGDEDEGPKVNIACHNCRARKLRCDGEKPRCHQCARTGQEACSYDKVLKRRGPGKKTREKEKEKERLRQQAKEEEMRERERILDLHRQNGASEEEIEAMRVEMAKGGGGRDKRDDRGFVDVQIERHPLSDGWGAKRAKVAEKEGEAGAGVGAGTSGTGAKTAAKGKTAARGGQAATTTTAAAARSGSGSAPASAVPTTEHDAGSAIAPELMRASQPSSHDYGHGYGHGHEHVHGYEHDAAYPEQQQYYHDREYSHGRDGGSAYTYAGGSRYAAYDYGADAGYGYAQGPATHDGHGQGHGHYPYDRGYGNGYARGEYGHAPASASASSYDAGYAYGTGPGSGSPTGNGNGNGHGHGYGYGHGYAYEGTPPDAPRVIRMRTPEVVVGASAGVGVGWEEGERGVKRRAEEQGGRE